METFLKRDVRSVIFVVALGTMGASIAYLLIADTDNKTFWGLSINAFACLCTTISATKRRAKALACFNVNF